MTKLTLKLAALALLVFIGSGCISRTALTIENSPAKSVTILQTLDQKSFLVMGTTAYRYWRCVEKGDELVCYPDCGASGTDLQCPGFNLD